jgi:tRNA threonylcarbamoyladenosine biosynthesis protein TsaE
MQIGSKLRGGETIELVGDLGAGKTEFVRGLARGLGSSDQVHSPSFTLSNQYKAAGLTLHHFDFYRLFEPGIMRDELAEVLNDPKAVVVIEWANVVANILPPTRLKIRFVTSAETKRQLTFEYPDELGYLVPANT